MKTKSYNFRYLYLPLITVSLLILAGYSLNDFSLFNSNENSTKELNVQNPVLNNSGFDTNSATNKDWYSSVVEQIKKEEYNITYSDNDRAYQSPNRKNGYRFYYYPDGFGVEPRVKKDSIGNITENWKINFIISGSGRGNAKETFIKTLLKVDKNKAFCENNNLRIEYINNEEGMRQNFILKEKPYGNNENVFIEMKLNTKNLTGTGADDGIVFTANDGKEVMSYSGLKVWDRNKKELNAKFRIIDNSTNNVKSFRIEVDDSQAEYPITIDPLSQVPRFYAGMPGSNIFVTNAGDINGDGFSDVIAIDFDLAAYIWICKRKTNNGPLTISQIAVINNPCYYASTAGDVNGDGYSDIIISENRTISGNKHIPSYRLYYGSSWGVDTNENQIWSYDYLDTNNYPLYDYQTVSTAGDVNDDGYSDIIVRIMGVTNDSSHAFVIFYGGSSGLSSESSDTIKSFFPYYYLGENIAFAGDVDGNGYSDVIVDGSEINLGIYRKFFRIYFGTENGISNYLYEDINFQSYTHSVLPLRFCTAGDVNGDGYSDVMVHKTTDSIIYVYYGSEEGISQLGIWKCTIEGEYYVNQDLNFSLAGDINWDGYSDIIVGNQGDSSKGSGKVWLWLGSEQGLNKGINGNSWNASSMYIGADSMYNYASSIFTAGDANGDGYSDIIIGYKLDTVCYADIGFEIRTGSPKLLLNYEEGVSVLEQPHNGDDYGWSVNTAGDINGDGYSDVIIGAPYYDNGQSNEGAIFLYRGSDIGVDSTYDELKESNLEGAVFGWSVSTAGDVNGDGYSDIIIGAPYSYDYSGKVYVYFGSMSGLIEDPWTTLGYFNQDTSAFGYCVSTAGDVNGDGYSDIIIGAPYFNCDSLTDAGAVFVYYGHKTGLNYYPPWISFFSLKDSSKYGFSVSSAGDLNADGLSDIVIGAPCFDTLGGGCDGSVYVYLGSVYGLKSKPNITLGSLQTGSKFGFSVTGADVDWDGFSEIIVGAPLCNVVSSNEGRVYIYDSPTVIFEIDGIGEGSNFGHVVSSAGDINADGRAEIIIGAPYFNGKGKFYVYNTSSFTEPLFSQEALQNAELGFSVASCGDVNKDGYSDIIVGAKNYNNSGRVYILYGNGLEGRRSNVLQEKLSGGILVGPLGLSGANNQIKLSIYGKSPYGKADGKFIAEIRNEYQWFAQNTIKPYENINEYTGFTSQETDYLPLGNLSIPLIHYVNNLSTNHGYKWRARIKYNTVKNPYQVYSPWRYYTAYTPSPFGGFRAEDENVYFIDSLPPQIYYTPLADTNKPGHREILATIADNRRIPTTGAYIPRIYFKKNETGRWKSQAGQFIENIAGSYYYSFHIYQDSIGTLSGNDTIFYFIIAQDSSLKKNIAAVPGEGLFARNVNEIFDYPTNIYQYKISDNDTTPPDIAYSPLSDTNIVVNRTIRTIISDSSGIPVYGAFLPRIYYKKNYNGEWISRGGQLDSGNYLGGKWTFTIKHDTLGEIKYHDSIFYFITAQDSSLRKNIKAVPGYNFYAFNVREIMSYPEDPYFYIFMNNDTVGPEITYTPLNDTNVAVDRTIIATLEDTSGVAFNGAYKPRIYFRKNYSGEKMNKTGISINEKWSNITEESRGWLFEIGTLIDGNWMNGVWKFTIVQSRLGTLSGNDSIFYFIIAQDSSIRKNVSAFPGDSLIAASVTEIEKFPVNPYYYKLSDNDTSGPDITFDFDLGDTTKAGDRVVTVNISDSIGVPDSGPFKPRIYYRKNDEGQWKSESGSHSSTSKLNNKWTFTIRQDSLGTLSGNDSISYFIIAQDTSLRKNIRAVPGEGLIATSVIDISAFPTNPKKYKLADGDISGPEITYPQLGDTNKACDRTITALISDINGVPLSGLYQPRIYYKKNDTGPWKSDSGILGANSRINNSWTFIIKYDSLGTLNEYDSIFYFIISEDLSLRKNINAVPGQGLVASSVIEISTYPSNPYKYKIDDRDSIGPSVTYSALNDTNKVCDRIITANLIDSAGGIPVTGAFKPRIYFKKNDTGPWNSDTGSLVSGDWINGNWNFVIKQEVLGTLNNFDSIFYFIIAQDSSFRKNITAVPGEGLTATSVINITGYPLNPYKYKIDDKDSVGPSVSYNALNDTNKICDRIITANLFDSASGIPVTGAFKPRIYFKKNETGLWNSDTGSLTSGDWINGNWNFVIKQEVLGTLNNFDSIFYFIIAQDSSFRKNITAVPGEGLTATSVINITNYPSNPNKYRIIENDSVGPFISYSQLSDTNKAGNRIIMANLIDSASGISVTGAFKPRIYFKKNDTGLWISDTGSLASGDWINGIWNFIIKQDTLGALSGNDSIYYFIIAQDSSVRRNIRAVQGEGLIASSVVNIMSYPVNAFKYKLSDIDSIAPFIYYYQLADTNSPGNRIITANLIDSASGIPLTGVFKPRIYFKKNDTGPWISDTGSLASGDWINGIWNFTIKQDSLGALSGNDSIYYFIIAQDSSLRKNIKAVPGDSLLAVNVNTINKYPVNPYKYKLTFSPVSGEFHIGSGKTFPDLDSAVKFFNQRIITAPVIFYLDDPVDSSFKKPNVFPITIYPNPGSSYINTLTIKPNTGNSCIISGSTPDSSILKINGADYVVIDGSNTIGGTTRNLTIEHMTDTTIFNYMYIYSSVLIEYFGYINPSKNISIKNCNIRTSGNCYDDGWGNHFYSIGIFIRENESDSISITNNNIYKAAYGISSGRDFSSYNKNKYLNISNNIIGSNDSGNYIKFTGIFIDMEVKYGEIKQNTIFNISGHPEGSYYNTYRGIYIEDFMFDNSVISGNLIYNIGNKTIAYFNGYPTSASGILITGGDSLKIFNNVLYGIISSSGPIGMWLSIAHSDISFNSISLSGTLPYASGINPIGSDIYCDMSEKTNIMKNNILYNSLNTSASSGRNYCISANQNIASAPFIEIDNNDYYVSTQTPGIGCYIGKLGQNSEYTTLSDWQAITGDDENSLDLNPEFNNPNSNLQLYISTPLVGEGAPISGINVDFLGLPRNISSPTIGAYENDVDLIGPEITYSELQNTTSILDRGMSEVIITDTNKVDSTVNRPRIYYKRNTDSNTYFGNTSSTGGWKYSLAVGTGNSPYSFIIDYTKLSGDSGVSLGTGIQYFIIAQDLAVIPNVTAKNAFFNNIPSSIALTSANFPVTGTYSYIITLGPMAGDYIIGISEFEKLTGKKYIKKNSTGKISKLDNYNKQLIKYKTGKGEIDVGGIYPTITEAISDISVRGMYGAVRFLLVDSIYSTNETFPVLIDSINGLNSDNTITIKPYTGIRPVISGNNVSAIFELNNTRYITIDGSNAENGTTKDLTIKNSTNNGSAIYIYSLGVNKGSQYITIKNCNIQSGSKTGDSYGIHIKGQDNDSITIRNNKIYNSNGAIVSLTTADAIPPLNEYLNISENILGSDDSTEYLGQGGIGLKNINNAVINNNTIYNIISSENSVTGIWLSGRIKNANISRNNINNLKYTGINGRSETGISIEVSSYDTNANINIYNNIIYGILGDGNSSTINNPIGILLYSGNAINLYYNSISLSGTRQAGNYASGCGIGVYINSGVSMMRVKDNILSCTQNSARTSLPGYNYGIYCLAPASAFSEIDFNDYYAYSQTPGLMYYLGYIGGYSRASITEWRTATGKDTNSKALNPLFKNPDTDLRLPDTSSMIGAGTPVSGINNDYLGITRNILHPTIGAYENGASGPLITYSQLGNISSTTNRVLNNVIITDINKVDSAVNRPRVYYRRSTDSNTFMDNTSSTNGWKYTIAVGTSGSPYSFTIDYSKLYGGTGVSSGTYVEYFIVAQDLLSPPYAAGKKATFTNNPLNVNLVSSNFPVTGTDSYKIVGAPMAGDYTIGITEFEKVSGLNLKFEKRIKKETVPVDIPVEEDEINTAENNDTSKEKKNAKKDDDSQDLKRGIKYRTEIREVETEYSVAFVNDKEYQGKLFAEYSVSNNKKTKDIKGNPTGVYATITSAISDIRERGMNGAVRFLLVDASYSAGETFPILIDSVSGASDVNTITIKPGTGVVPTIVSSNASNIFDMNKARYVIIDGSNTEGGTTKDLTINKANTSGYIVNFVNDACYNIIKNTNLIVSGTKSITSQVVRFYTTTGWRGCDSNKIHNCTIDANWRYYGVSFYGTSGKNGDNNVISSCDIFNFSNYGIWIYDYYEDFVISGNSIHANEPISYTPRYGIYKQYGVNKCSITGNYIYDLKTTSSGSTETGIYISSGGDTVDVYNNVISLQSGTNLNSGATVNGIYISGVTGRISRIYNNSVYIAGSGVTTGSSNGIYAGTNIKKYIFNNIIYNGRSNSSGTGNHRGLYLELPGTGVIATNYNDVYVSGAGGVWGRYGTTNYTTLQSWITGTGLDKYSYSGNPGYSSLINLRPDSTNANCWNIYMKAMPLPQITTDIRGVPRSTTIVDGQTCIGAYEFTTTVAALIATPSGSPSAGATTSYSQSSHKLLEITWGAADNEREITKQNNDNVIKMNKNIIYEPDVLPTTVNVQFFSGLTPPDTVNMSVAKTGKGYWKVDTDRDPVNPVNVKVYWGDQDLGNITDTSKLILAMYDMKSRVWIPFERGTSGNGYSIISHANKTITVNGLTRIDSVCFALTSSQQSLRRLRFDLTVLIEGLYYDGGLPGYQVRDTARVIMCDSVNSWASADTIIVQLDSLGKGIGFTSFSSINKGYYIVIKHRNSLETWSAFGNNIFPYTSGLMSYDFTTAQSQAYGSNMIQKNGKWCIYSGDIVQDGFVDGADMAPLDNDLYNYVSGYVITDLNGDQFVDGADMAILDNNLYNYIGVIKPEGTFGYFENIHRIKREIIKTNKNNQLKENYNKIK